MSLDLTQLRDTLRTTLGVPTNHPKFDTTALDLLLNRSYWALLSSLEFREKEATGTFPTVASERYYDLPTSFDYLRHLSILDPNTGGHIQLIQMSPAEYENNYNETSSYEGIPTNYVREGCGIRLYPTPDQAYTVTIKYAITLADLSASNTDPGIPQEWHEIIGYGAAYRGLLMLGDFPRYQQYYALYNAEVLKLKPTKFKEEEDNRFASVTVYRPEYRV